MRTLIEVPVCLQGKDGNADKEVVARINPSNICGYYPAYHWGSVIMMQSGAEFLTTYSTEEIDTALSNINFQIFQHASS